MRLVLTEYHPDRPTAILAPQAPEEAADVDRSFAGEEGPPAAVPVGLAKHEQVEVAPPLLLSRQDQPMGAGLASPAKGTEGPSEKCRKVTHWRPALPHVRLGEGDGETCKTADNSPVVRQREGWQGTLPLLYTLPREFTAAC